MNIGLSPITNFVSNYCSVLNNYQIAFCFLFEEPKKDTELKLQQVVPVVLRIYPSVSLILKMSLILV